MAEEITYDNYLKIRDLLECQKPKSEEENQKSDAKIPKSVVQEEILFILTHQAFELWFKQILGDIDFVRDKLDKPERSKPHKSMRMIVRASERIVKIFKLVTQQFAVLETMSPMEFMDFRGFLSPASGFQSRQFRLIEIRLGLADDKRLKYDDKPYTTAFAKEANDEMDEAKKEDTLLRRVEKWLETTPGLRDPQFNFVEKLKENVTRWQEEQGKSYEESQFAKILDEVRYQEDVDNGHRRISRDAFLGALIISLYREEPFFQQSYTFLKLLMDIEEAVWMWRSNHVMMVHRMIGTKVGTGGSSGVGYLRATLEGERYRVFVDLFNVSTYLVPTAFIPPLPPALKQSLAFTRDEDVAVGVGAMGL